MPDQLRLQISIEEDGTAELFASVEANDFSGRGSGWVSQDQLLELGAKLASAFPLSEQLEIRAGYWSRSVPDALEQEHLGLTFYPVEGRGVVGCQVRLASALQSSDRPQSQQRVVAEILTSYQELQRFSGELRGLASGAADEAVLHAVTP